MTKIKTTSALSGDILAPLIKHCADHRGALTEVAKLFNQGLAEPIRMSTIAKWLCKEEAKRIEPSGGSLLRLCNTWMELRGPDCENHPTPNIFCTVNGHNPSRNGLNCIKCGSSL